MVIFLETYYKISSKAYMRLELPLRSTNPSQPEWNLATAAGLDPNG
jgi:hypothetical protein